VACTFEEFAGSITMLITSESSIIPLTTGAQFLPPSVVFHGR